MKSIFSNYPVENGTYNDAVQYIRVLHFIAGVDGVHEDEVKAIKFLISSHNWADSCYDDALKSPLKSISELNLSDETKQIFSVYIVRDSVAIAHMEGGYSQIERDHIAAIAKEFLISDDKLRLVEKAVENQINSIRDWSKALNS